MYICKATVGQLLLLFARVKIVKYLDRFSTTANYFFLPTYAFSPNKSSEGALNLQDRKMMDKEISGGWKLQDWKMTDECAGLENAGQENDGQHNRGWKMRDWKLTDKSAAGKNEKHLVLIKTTTLN